MKYTIYQLELEHPNKFLSYERTKKLGVPIRGADYKTIYSGEMNEDLSQEDALDKLYFLFNSDSRPNAFAGHSLSISDVVVLDEKDAYYVDIIGFKKLPCFLSSVYYIKNGKTLYHAVTLDAAFQKYQEIPNHLEKEIGIVTADQPWIPVLKCENGMDFFAEKNERFEVFQKTKALLEEMLESHHFEWFYHVCPPCPYLGSFVEYIEIHTSEEGYDYTLFDENYGEIDGGVCEERYPDTDVIQVLEDILMEEREEGTEFRIMDHEVFEDNIE